MTLVRIRIAPCAAALLLGALAAPAWAQGHPHPPADSAAPDTAAGHPAAMHAGVAETPGGRDGSGTAWLPQLSPVYAHHGTAGRWQLMLHENVFVQYLADGGPRGHEQLGSSNWVMGMARRPLAGGELTLRAMLSAEPLTVGECGYPDLLATGELCDGEPIVDRQHPHDLFMELAASYRRALGGGVAVELYGGPAAEPALGPVAFPHRVSALANPIAPISHHWLDATHIAFGVATVGLLGRGWKIEASAFNGREPDEDRFDLDLARLDSWSARATIAPGEQWVIQLSGGHLAEAEAPHEPGGSRVDVERYTASAIHHRPLGQSGLWSATLAWGRNVEEGAATDAVLLESGAQLGHAHELFARAELVEKSSHDLALDELGDRLFRVGKLSAGYVFSFGTFGGLVPGVGISGSVGFVPGALQPYYGTAPLGLALYARVRPPALGAHDRHAADAMTR